jgi:WD40 repeat protein
MRPTSLLLAVVCLSAEPGDRVLQSDGEITSVAFLRDGGLAALGRDGKIRVWDLKSDAPARTIERAKGEGGTTFLAARGQFAVIGEDGGIKIRGLASGDVVRQWAGPTPRVGGFVSTGDGGALAAAGRPYAGSSENLVRVWNAEGREKFKVPAGIGGVSAMAFSPDGGTLVAAAYDTDVRVWSAANGELKRVVEEMTVSMFELAFSPDGKLLAAAGVDRTVYLWDTKTWRLVRKITGQPEMISAMDFSPDGKLIVTGGMNELAFGAPVKVMLWDVATGKAVRTMGADHRAAGAAFSPDGKLVAVADYDKTVSVWAVPGR